MELEYGVFQPRKASLSPTAPSGMKPYETNRLINLLNIDANIQNDEMRIIDAETQALKHLDPRADMIERQYEKKLDVRRKTLQLVSFRMSHDSKQRDFISSSKRFLKRD